MTSYCLMPSHWHLVVLPVLCFTPNSAFAVARQTLGAWVWLVWAMVGAVAVWLMWQGRQQHRPRARLPDQLWRAAAADVRQLNVCPRSFRTRFGGVFLFRPDLIACHGYGSEWHVSVMNRRGSETRCLLLDACVASFL